MTRTGFRGKERRDHRIARSLLLRVRPASRSVNAQFPRRRRRRGPLLWRGRWSLTDRTLVRRRPHVSDAHSLSPGRPPCLACVAETAVAVAANVTHPLPSHPPSLSLPGSPLSFLPPFPPTFPLPSPLPFLLSLRELVVMQMNYRAISIRLPSSAGCGGRSFISPLPPFRARS